MTDPPSSPPVTPMLTGGVSVNDALTGGDISERDGVLIGLWVVLVVFIFLLGSWAFYFRWYRGHKFSELYKTSYLWGPVGSAAAAVKNGQITPTSRIEIRGKAGTKLATTVRATPPGNMSVQQVPRRTATVAPLLDPDALLTVSYAPNVPKGGAQPHSPHVAAYAGQPQPQPTRIVDLSEATDALLRGEQGQAPAAYFQPNYQQNVPRDISTGAPSTAPRRSQAPLGGLAAVQEEDRAGTWGQYDGNDSQATWLTDDGMDVMQLPPGTRREVSGSPELPSPRGDSNPALLRI